MSRKWYQPEEAKNFQVSTNGADGTQWVTLPDLPCDRVRMTTSPINGQTGAAIEVRRSPVAGVTPDTFGFPVPLNTITDFKALRPWGDANSASQSNAKNLQIRRVDQANTVFTVTCEAQSGGI
jgi:hypothetical protein